MSPISLFIRVFNTEKRHNYNLIMCCIVYYFSKNCLQRGAKIVQLYRNLTSAMLRVNINSSIMSEKTVHVNHQQTKSCSVGELHFKLK